MNDIQYKDWLKKIDDIVFSKIKMHIDDLPDKNYYMLYEDSYDYNAIANMVINNATNTNI